MYVDNLIRTFWGKKVGGGLRNKRPHFWNCKRTALSALLYWSSLHLTH